jgi:hypothetical protein
VPTCRSSAGKLQSAWSRGAEKYPTPERTGDFKYAVAKLNGYPSRKPKPARVATSVSRFLESQTFQEERQEIESSYPGFLEKLAGLHSPPRGGAVERSRLNFYLERAMKTRRPETSTQEKDAADLTELREFDEIFSLSLETQFYDVLNDRSFAFDPNNLFIEHHLRQDVFHRALSHVTPSSSPGYPFLEATNEEVDLKRLYDLVDRCLGFMVGTQPYATDPDDVVAEILSGIRFPNSSFIKGEPTSQTKIARNIYGDSLVSNVITRILFGDFLLELPKTYQITSHKIGLNFTDDSGLTQLEFCFRKHLAGETVISDDAQGWEYMVPPLFLDRFLRAYTRCNLQNNVNLSPEAKRRYTRLMSRFCMFLNHKVCLDSDGYLHLLPFWIVFSGIVLTHALNSFTRAAMARVDRSYIHKSVLARFPEFCPFLASSGCIATREATNGDDCVFTVDVQQELIPPASEWPSSRLLGFVHTDITYSSWDLSYGVRFDFCSQRFILSQDSLQCRPLDIHKTFYNVLKNVDDGNQEGIDGGLSYLARSMAYSASKAVVDKLVVAEVLLQQQAPNPVVTQDLVTGGVEPCAQ